MLHHHGVFCDTNLFKFFYFLMLLQTVSIAIRYFIYLLSTLTFHVEENSKPLSARYLRMCMKAIDANAGATL